MSTSTAAEVKIIWVLDTHWNSVSRKYRFGHMSTHGTLESAYRRFADTLQIIAQTGLEEATNITLETNSQGGTYTEFDAAGRHWESHLYPEIKGQMKKMRKFR